ncbi:MAG: hypothetical protein ACRCS8_00295 [Brevinema sp.]
MRKILILLFLTFIAEPTFCQVTTIQEGELSYQLIPQYELPKRYLIDGQTRFYPTENPFRRADIVFFLSIPASYFVMQNLLNLFTTIAMSFNNYNSGLIRDNFGFTWAEWSFIIASVTMIPMGVMIYDAVYVRDYPILPPFKQDEIKEVRVNFTLYRVDF